GAVGGARPGPAPGSRGDRHRVRGWRRPISFHRSVPECAVRVAISAGAFEALRVHALAAYPNEGCGVLIGAVGGGGAAGAAGGSVVSVVDVTSAINRVSSRLRDRYDLDPADMVRADREARARGLDVVG